MPGDLHNQQEIDTKNWRAFSTEHMLRLMTPHAILLSALHTLTARTLPATAKALFVASGLDQLLFQAALRRVARDGLVRFVGRQAHLTLPGFAVASAMAATGRRRVKLSVVVAPGATTRGASPIDPRPRRRSIQRKPTYMVRNTSTPTRQALRSPGTS